MFGTTSQGGGVLPNGCLVQPGGEVWFPIGHTLPPELLRSGQRVSLPPSAFQRGASLPKNTVSLQAVQTTPHAFSRQGSYSISQLETGVHQNEFELQRSQMTQPVYFPTQVQRPLMQPLDIPTQVQQPMRQPWIIPTPVHCPMQQPLDVPINAQCQMQQPLVIPTPVPGHCPIQQPLRIPTPVHYPMQQPLEVQTNAQYQMQQPLGIPTPVQCPMQKPLEVPINAQDQRQQPLDFPTQVQRPMQQPLEVPSNAQRQMQQLLVTPTPVHCSKQQPLEVPINAQDQRQQPLVTPTQVQRQMQQPLVIPTPIHCQMQQQLEVPSNSQRQMQQPLDVPFLPPLDLSYNTVQNPGHVHADVPKPSEYPPQDLLDLERYVQHEQPEPSKASEESFYKQKAAENTLQIYDGYLPHCDPNEILAVKLDPKVKPVFPKMVNPACHPACVDLNFGEMDGLLESAFITCPTPASGNKSAVFSLDDLVDMLSETQDNKLDSGVEGLTEGGLSAHLTRGVPSPAFGPASPAVPVDSSNAQMTSISCPPKKRQRQPNKRRVPTARVKPQPQKRKLVSDDLKSPSLSSSPSKPECCITLVDKDDDIEPRPKQRKLDSEDMKYPSSSISPPQSPDCIVTQVDNVDVIEPFQVQVNHEAKVIKNGPTGEEKESRDKDAMDTRDDDGHLTFKIPQALRRLFC